MSNGQEQVRYYGVPVVLRRVDTAVLAEDITEFTALSSADVYAVLEALSRVMMMHLKRGESISLHHIGAFTLSATGEGCDTPEECTSSKLKASRICFKMGTRWREELKGVKFDKREELYG